MLNPAHTSAPLYLFWQCQKRALRLVTFLIKPQPSIFGFIPFKVRQLCTPYISSSTPPPTHCKPHSQHRHKVVQLLGREWSTCGKCPRRASALFTVPPAHTHSYEANFDPLTLHTAILHSPT